MKRDSMIAVRPMVAVVAVSAASVLGSCGSGDSTSEEVPASTDVAVEAEEVTAAEQAAGAAEARAVEAEQRAVEAEERAAVAEERATTAEDEAEAAEERAVAAQERVASLRTRVGTLREKVDELQAQLEAVTATAPDANQPTTTTGPSVPTDPFLIPAGVIEDGYHVGYLTALGDSSFSFDMAEIRSDGSWKNENPKIRTLPMAPSANMLFGALPGTPIEMYVASQHVQWVVSLV